MDIEAHWQTLYNEIRAGLDAGGHSFVPVYHVDSTNDQTGDPAAPPMVVYRDETMRPTGTQGGGNSVVLRSGFLITVRAYSLSDALGYVSDIATRLDAADATVTTTDGYATSNIEILGSQTIYETEFKLYAQHLRIEWERSL